MGQSYHTNEAVLFHRKHQHCPKLFLKHYLIRTDECFPSALSLTFLYYYTTYIQHIYETCTT